MKHLLKQLKDNISNSSELNYKTWFSSLCQEKVKKL